MKFPQFPQINAYNILIYILINSGDCSSYYIHVSSLHDVLNYRK